LSVVLLIHVSVDDGDSGYWSKIKTVKESYS